MVNGIIGNLTGNVTGNLSGNASTATKLQTARTLTIGNTGKSFDGSSNVSWTLSEIGAASSRHTHNYLPLSGGTITGQLYLTGLEEGSSDITDNTELLTSYASNNGFGDTNATGKVYKRDAVKVYNYIKGKLDSVYSAIGHTHSYLPLSGGTMTGSIILKGGTSGDMTYTGNAHPYLRFDNSDSSQNVSLIFTDYDAYRSPAGIKLVGNQGNEWFEATNIYATTFYGALSGNASTATKLTSSAGNTSLPVYFSDGKPVACNKASIFSNLSNNGNDISITIAG